MAKKRVLSGIRATGRLHLGNYLGAIQGMLKLQKDQNYETLYMVADLHSINVVYDPKKFQKAVREVVLDYLSAGLDPQKSTIFIQSQVPEHVELAYLFSNVVSVARMRHLPTYKEKIKLQPKNINMGLLYYPILMAADILIYKASAVPVGDDQLAHLEVAREIARKMNKLYKMDFPQPQQFKTKGHYIPSLLGTGKMSKSVAGSYINLTDSLKEIENKLAKVPTDLGKGKTIPQEGGVATLLYLVELFQGEAKREELEKQYLKAGIKYASLKAGLAKAIFKELEPIQKKRKELKKNPKYVEKVLEQGAIKARKIAAATLQEVKEKMGLV